MTAVSPLNALHTAAGATLRPYGPALPDGSQIELVESFGELELEYAALRKHCVIIDRPDRAVIELQGPDRLDFLNRMITQELKACAPHSTRRSFWLSRKGRIDADLRLIHLPTRTLLDLDAHAAERTAKGLAGFIITEDCSLADRSKDLHRFSLFGPSSLQLLTLVSSHVAGSPLSTLAPGAACELSIAGIPVIADRDDSAGELGIELTVPADRARDLYTILLDTGRDPRSVPGETSAAALRPPSDAPGARIRLRPAGWHAYNIARIEAGTPLYNLDFGPDSLPAETGVLEDRVSFTKGCYLGQEVVARMHARHQFKQKLVALAVESRITDTATGEFVQPVTASHVLHARDSAEPVGGVTSATISPMTGSAPVCFAMLKSDHTAPGTRVVINVDAWQLDAVVQPTLTFYRRA